MTRYSTVEVCADVELGDRLVKCQCGKSRPVDKPCGWVNEKKRARQTEEEQEAERLAFNTFRE